MCHSVRRELLLVILACHPPFRSKECHSVHRELLLVILACHSDFRSGSKAMAPAVTATI